MSKRAMGSHFVTGICGASIKATNFDNHMKKCKKCKGAVPSKLKPMYPFWKRKSRIQTEFETDIDTDINFKKKEML